MHFIAEQLTISFFAALLSKCRPLWKCRPGRLSPSAPSLRHWSWPMTMPTAYTGNSLGIKHRYLWY